MEMSLKYVLTCVGMMLLIKVTFSIVLSLGVGLLEG